MTSYNFENDQQLVSYLKQESNEEFQYSEHARKTIDKAINPLVKIVLEIISQDSIKHSKIYETMALIIENPQLITEKESEMALYEIKNHIEVERVAVQNLNNLLEDEKIKRNNPLKLLLELLFNDELIHHTMLLTIYDLLISNKSLAEEDIWDQIWKEILGKKEKNV